MTGCFWGHFSHSWNARAIVFWRTVCTLLVFAFGQLTRLLLSACASSFLFLQVFNSHPTRPDSIRYDTIRYDPIHSESNRLDSIVQWPFIVIGSLIVIASRTPRQWLISVWHSWYEYYTRLYTICICQILEATNLSNIGRRFLNILNISRRRCFLAGHTFWLKSDFGKTNC